jgi:hypothetical protein
MDVVSPKAPSKRGRKPKVSPITTAPLKLVSETTLTLSAEPASPPHVTAQKQTKRGRKPKAVFHCEDTAHDALSHMSEDENIVLNLRVKTTLKEDEEDVLSQNNGLDGIDGYNPDNSFLSMPFELHHHDSLALDATLDEIKSVQDESIVPQNNLKVVDLLKDFEEKNKLNEWPTNTSISCYWCCHRFNNIPFGIPVKYSDSKFHVYGCFCSLECAASYNMTNKDSVDELWERYNLINMLSRKLGYTNIVKPAPNRLSLKMFGGHMDIDEFRKYCETSKIININFPPMMTITQQIEEVNESDLNNDFRYIPIDTDRINRFKEKMKLKRSKPVTNFKNTLDHTMNLKYIGT